MSRSPEAIITAYDRSRDLIVVMAQIEGPAATLQLQLALDTGCTHTTLRPHAALALGYGRADHVRRSTVRTAVGEEHGGMIRVAALDAIGHGFSEVPVNVVELAAGYDIDGLLGLSFLNQLNYEIRAREGVIIAERADTGPLSAGS